MPDERREIRLKRPASHTTLDGSFLIPRGVEGLQGDVDEVESTLGLKFVQEKAATDLHGFSRIESREQIKRKRPSRHGFARVHADQSGWAKMAGRAGCSKTPGEELYEIRDSFIDQCARVERAC